MVDRLFEFLHLFWRNATVVLRWNVRVDRTGGSDCHLPLPFQYCPCLRVHEDAHGVKGLQLELPRLLHADARRPSAPFVPMERNGFRDADHQCDEGGLTSRR